MFVLALEKVSHVSRMKGFDAEPLEVGIVQGEDGATPADEGGRRKPRIVNLHAPHLVLDDKTPPLVVHGFGVVKNTERRLDER